MNKIFKTLRRVIAVLGERAPHDPLATLSCRELADLPVYHPQSDR